MTDAPTVSVLIPVRNEEADIERCLRAVLAQDYPHDRVHIAVIDGGSSDRTSFFAASVLSDGDIEWKIIDNPVGTTPSNLNAGLVEATGELVCRIDARSIVPKNYIRLCAEVLSSRSEVAVTGGAQVAVAVDDSTMSVGIARALNNKFAMGGSRYRSDASSGPSDTVYLGAFRTGQLRSAGGWDEYFHTNQDYELNRRMARCGDVWFDGRLEVGYIPRQSLVALWRQYHRFGRWKVRYWRRTNERPQRRQILPIFAAPLAVAAVVMLCRRPRAAVVAALVGLATGLGVDGHGTRDGPAPLTARLVALTSVGTTALAWSSGVWRQSALSVLAK